jgi:hypothetical protein
MEVRTDAPDPGAAGAEVRPGEERRGYGKRHGRCSRRLRDRARRRHGASGVARGPDPGGQDPTRHRAVPRGSFRNQVRHGQAALHQAEADLDRTMIRAPIDGIVIDRTVAAGRAPCSQSAILGRERRNRGGRGRHRRAARWPERHVFDRRLPVRTFRISFADLWLDTVRTPASREEPSSQGCALCFCSLLRKGLMPAVRRGARSSKHSALLLTIVSPADH